MMMSAIALAIISTTGSSTVARVMPNDGRGVVGLVVLASPRTGRGGGDVDPAAGEPAEQRTGDDHGRDGDEHAERQRRTEVGAQGVDREQRAGVRRHEAVHGREAGQRRDADRDQRTAGRAGRRGR